MTNEPPKKCIKFLYRKQLRYIICDLASSYEDVVSLLLERFCIPEEYRSGLLITNERGQIFEEYIFDYFILLFPNPLMVFHVHIDYRKVLDKMPVAAPAKTPTEAISVGAAKHNHKRPYSEVADYEAVPVCRQNCFMGMLPINTAMTQNLSEIMYSRQVAKRMRQEIKSQMLSSVMKRSFRI